MISFRQGDLLCLVLFILMTGMGMIGTGCLKISSSSRSSDNSPAEETAGGGEEAPEQGGEEDRAPDPFIVALGDSLTTGVALPARAPYPARVATITGMRVVNAGVSGESACAGAKRAGSAMSSRPATVLILFGTNDVIAGHDLNNSKECLRQMIRNAFGAGARPILGTIPPMRGEMANLNARVNEMNGHIRALAGEEGCRLVDVHGQFGNGEGLLLPDGFHPNETGTQLIAFAFADAL